MFGGWWSSWWFVFVIFVFLFLFFGGWGSIGSRGVVWFWLRVGTHVFLGWVDDLVDERVSVAVFVVSG